MRAIRRAAGFTLPEVLIAAMLVFLLLGIIFTMWSLFARVQIRTEVRLDRVSWFASALGQLAADLERATSDAVEQPRVGENGRQLTLPISVAASPSRGAGVDTRTVTYRFAEDRSQLLRDGKPIGRPGQGSVQFELADDARSGDEPAGDRPRRLRATFTAAARPASPRGTTPPADPVVLEWSIHPALQSPGSPRWIPGEGEPAGRLARTDEQGSGRRG